MLRRGIENLLPCVLVGGNVNCVFWKQKLGKFRKEDRLLTGRKHACGFK